VIPVEGVNANVGANKWPAGEPHTVDRKVLNLLTGSSKRMAAKVHDDW
jgi:hypothetical protein